MSTSKPFQALRRVNPRTKPGFSGSVEATHETVRAQIAITAADLAPTRAAAHSRPRRVLVGGSVVGASLAAAAVVAFLLIGSPSGGPGVQDAGAAVRQAATLTAASAEQSGTAVVRLSHNSEPLAGTTIRWSDGDVSIFKDGPGRAGKVGSAFLVVDGVLYGLDAEDGGWVVLGRPENIDPNTGTTPGEHLAAVRQDIGGATLRRIIGGMTDLTTRRLADGSTVYRGTLAAGLIARETGFKEGRSIRVLPFGYVAQDEAADPSAPLDVAITVGPDGIVREDVVQWGTGGSVWTYAVTYSKLGKTAALPAPANARPLKDSLPRSDSSNAPTPNK